MAAWIVRTPASCGTPTPRRGSSCREPASTSTGGSSAPPRRELRDRHPPFRTTYAPRTLAGWLNAVLGAGLRIEAVSEPFADIDTAAAHPAVADTRLAPYFLIPRARKS